MTKKIRSVSECTGAVIGAGFASGREIVSFFSRYGSHSWWLIGVSAVMTTLLCWLVLRYKAASEDDWCSIFAGEPQWMQTTVRLCIVALMIMTGGAMVSAGGHIIALIWNHPWASSIGTAGTLAAAWSIGTGKMKRLSWLSMVLAAFFIGTAAGLWHRMPISRTVQVAGIHTAPVLLRAALYAIGYSAMNLTLAVGIINRSRQTDEKENARLSICFGIVMLVLLAAGNTLFSRYSECQSSDFPMMYLLRTSGQIGYLAGASLLYLAILTTLTAVLYSIRTAIEPVVRKKGISALGATFLPLAVSGIGFSGIVDSLYAPAGLACLLLVFVPLVHRKA